MSGDTLARGGRSAMFGPPKVSQKKWDDIWAIEPKNPKETKKEINGKQSQSKSDSNNRHAD